MSLLCRRLGVARLLALMLAVCGVGGMAKASAAPLPAAQVQRVRLALRSLAPAPKRGDKWHLAGRIQFFGVEGLPERFPAQAGAIAALNFRQGAAAKCAGPVGQTSLLLLDLGSVLYALAALERLQPADAVVVKLGHRGFQQGASWGFCKGAYVGIASGPDAEALARRVVKAVLGAEQPTLVDLLPAEGCVPGSVRALPAGVPELAFLGGAASATYKVDSQTATLYLLGNDAREEAGESFAALVERARAQGRAAASMPEMGDEVLSVEMGMLGRFAAVRVGKFIAITAGNTDMNVLRVPLAAVVATLKEKLGVQGVK